MSDENGGHRWVKEIREFKDGYECIFCADCGVHRVEVQNWQDNPKCPNTIRNMELQIRDLEALTRRIISDRGCTCNVPGHRCGTNLMLEDLEALIGRKP